MLRAAGDGLVSYFPRSPLKNGIDAKLHPLAFFSCDCPSVVDIFVNFTPTAPFGSVFFPLKLFKHFSASALSCARRRRPIIFNEVLVAF